MYTDFYEKIKTRVENKVFRDDTVASDILESLNTYMYKLKVDDIESLKYIDTYIACIEYYIQHKNIKNDSKAISIIFEKFEFNFWDFYSRLKLEFNISLSHSGMVQAIKSFYKWYINSFPKYINVLPLNKISHDILFDMMVDKPELVKYFMKGVNSPMYKERYIIFFLKRDKKMYRYLTKYIKELNLDDNEIVKNAKEVSLAKQMEELLG